MPASVAPARRRRHPSTRPLGDGRWVRGGEHRPRARVGSVPWPARSRDRLPTGAPRPRSARDPPRSSAPAPSNSHRRPRRRYLSAARLLNAHSSQRVTTSRELPGDERADPPDVLFGRASRPGSAACESTARRAAGPAASARRRPTRLARIRSFGWPVNRAWRSGSISFRSKSTRSARAGERPQGRRRAHPAGVEGRVQPECPAALQEGRQERRAQCGLAARHGHAAARRLEVGCGPSPPRRTRSSSVQRVPHSSMAPDGHASTHSPHSVQRPRSISISSPEREIASSGQTASQARERMHLGPCHTTCGFGDRPSGLWHQVHARLQPFTNTVVRSPGPSSVDIRWMLNTVSCGSEGSAARVRARGRFHLGRLLELTVAQPRDDLVLQLAADAREVGVVARDAHQQVPVVLRILLRVSSASPRRSR